jgi:hypothetical protein
MGLAPLDGLAWSWCRRVARLTRRAPVATTPRIAARQHRNEQIVAPGGPGIEAIGLRDISASLSRQCPVRSERSFADSAKLFESIP